MTDPASRRHVLAAIGLVAAGLAMRRTRTWGTVQASAPLRGGAPALLRLVSAPLAAPSSLLAIVTAATRAASSHNTQPWTVSLSDSMVSVKPDFTRRCPQVDPDDHHLYASLGCLAENIHIAARAAGWPGDVGVTLPHVADGRARLVLADGPRDLAPFAAAMAARQCTRSGFDGRSVPVPHLKLLSAAGTGDGVSMLLFTDPEHRSGTAEWVAQGNTAQIDDAAWREELVRWLRFSEGEAREHGDGLWSAATGNPGLWRAIGKVALTLTYSSRSQNKKEVPWITGSSGIAVFVSERNDAPHWIEAGRCYQRFALQATLLGIRHAFINQAVEVAALRPQFATWLGIGDRRPDLVVRFGYAEAMPMSFRRPMAAVLARDDG